MSSAGLVKACRCARRSVSCGTSICILPSAMTVVSLGQQQSQREAAVAGASSREPRQSARGVKLAHCTARKLAGLRVMHSATTVAAKRRAAVRTTFVADARQSISRCRC